MNTIVGMWLFIACFGQSCTGAETRIVPGLTEGQCLHLREVYGHLADYSETGKLPLFKDFRSADCVGPDGKRWEGADAGKAKRIKP
jgi:hypothetical protein